MKFANGEVSKRSADKAIFVMWLTPALFVWSIVAIVLIATLDIEGVGSKIMVFAATMFIGFKILPGLITKKYKKMQNVFD